MLSSETTPTDPTVTPMDRTSTERLESELLRSGWQLVDAHERLGPKESRRIFGAEHQAWVDYARSTVRQLEAWSDDHSRRRINETDNALVRYRRVLDFTRQGDRIFDVGFGLGYLLGVLLREGQLSAYHGVDVVDSYLDFVQTSLNNADISTEVKLAVRNLYDLTLEDTAATDLMICCEVLEHVPDAEEALKVLAAALPDSADLLFSVPMFGRLESVWGHLSVFDTHRLRQMLAGAGLYPHHVEPVANIWTFVLASKSPAPSERVAFARTRPPTNLSEPLVADYMFRVVEPTRLKTGRWASGATTTLEEQDGDMVRCIVQAGAAADGHTRGRYGGIAFEVESLSALRFKFALSDASGIDRIYIDLYDGEARVGRWSWKPSIAQRTAHGTFRFALRLGDDTSRFRLIECTPGAKVTDVEVFAKVRTESRASFDVCANYLP